jgi:CheY-like chemotaxis protein
MTGLLLDTGLAPEQREHAEIVQTSARSLLAILNNILDFSKMEAGRLVLNEVDLDPRAVLRSAADVLAHPASEKGLDLEVRGAPDLPPRLRGDPDRIRQVLVHLIDNAVKFTESGEVVVDARVETTEGARTVVRFSVRDTGIGVAEDGREQLFEPFTQADPSSTRRHTGTGLGLSICRQLVELMDGQIGLESRPGEGSTFFFRIPLERPPDDAEPGEARILVVEDNVVNQQVAIGMLRVLGHAADVAGHGGEAIEALARKPYDLVLMDCQMPTLDGFQATRLIRDPRSAVLAHDVPVVAMTAHAMEGDRERCLEAGMNDYLSKPIDPEALKAVLENWLRTLP